MRSTSSRSPTETPAPTSLLTWQAAREALEATLSAADPQAVPPDETLLPVLLPTWARGALLGARGNSGVIVCAAPARLGLTVAGAAEPHRSGGVDAGVLADALDDAVALAYSAVVHPVEGTILTVASEAARAARSAVDGAAGRAGHAGEPESRQCWRRLSRRQTRRWPAPPSSWRCSRAPVSSTPAGRASCWSWARCWLPSTRPLPTRRPCSPVGVSARAPGPSCTHPAPHAVVPCRDGAFEVMYLLDADDAAVPDLRERLDEIGASVVVVGGDGLWNVHVHTDDAGPAVEVGVAVGRVSPDPDHPAATESGDTRAAGATGDAAGHAAVRAAWSSRWHRPGPGGAASSRSARRSWSAAAPATVRRRVRSWQPPEGADEVLLLPNDDDHRAVAEAAARPSCAPAGVQVAVLPTHADVQGLAALAVRDAGRSFTDDVVAMSAAAACHPVRRGDTGRA